MVFTAFRNGDFDPPLFDWERRTKSYAVSLTASDKLAEYETTISPSSESKSSGELTSGTSVLTNRQSRGIGLRQGIH
jgi:hypothetical protein